jgi:cytochrome P450
MYPVTTEEAMQAAMQATGSMVGYFTQILEERRAHPQNDLVSALLMAEVDGERLSTEELMGFCVLLLVAGIDRLEQEKISGHLTYCWTHCATCA